MFGHKSGYLFQFDYPNSPEKIKIQQGNNIYWSSEFDFNRNKNV